jgi:hypothetical protein
LIVAPANQNWLAWEMCPLSVERASSNLLSVMRAILSGGYILPLKMERIAEG